MSPASRLRSLRACRGVLGHSGGTVPCAIDRAVAERERSSTECRRPDASPPTPSPQGDSRADGDRRPDRAERRPCLLAPSYARVVANELRVRAEPDDQSLVRQPSLPNGMLVVVVDGPVHASGYDWFQVQPTILEESAQFYPFGWVAGADKDGEPWLEPATVECPPLPSSLREVATLNHDDEMIYELTCFGDEEVTFRARLATSSAICGLELPYGLEPRWMTGACSIDPRYLVHVDPEEHGRAVHELGTRRRRAESRSLDAARRAAGRRGHRPVRPSRGPGVPRGRPVRDAKRGPPRSRFDRPQLPATVRDHRRSRSRGLKDAFLAHDAAGWPGMASNVGRRG